MIGKKLVNNRHEEKNFLLNLFVSCYWLLGWLKVIYILHFSHYIFCRKEERVSK